MSANISTHLAPLPAPDTVYQAFFARVAEHGLETTTISQLAADQHLPLSLLRRTYPTVGHILTAFSQSIDAAMQAAIIIDGQTSKRDLYFELLMARLDALQPYKDGLIRLSRDVRTRPDLSLLLLRQAHIMAETIIGLAGDDYPSWQKPLKRLGITALYAALLHVWRSDKTADLSLSMAFLDKQLDRLERWFDRDAQQAA